MSAEPQQVAGDAVGQLGEGPGRQATAAPAAMAQSNVTLYGKLYPHLINEKGGASA